MNVSSRHMEKTLGPIRELRDISVSPEMNLRLAKFSRGPHQGSVAYGTLNLSDHDLFDTDYSRSMRQEAILLAPSEMNPDYVISVLERTVTNLLKKHLAFPQGFLTEFSEPILEDTAMYGFYVAPPVYFDNSFFYFEKDGRTAVVVWLVPVTQEEIHFIKNKGWEKFERLLAAQDPDLVDFHRKSVA